MRRQQHNIRGENQCAAVLRVHRYDPKRDASSSLHIAGAATRINRILDPKELFPLNVAKVGAPHSPHGPIWIKDL
jgi:hypothetical protein